MDSLSFFLALPIDPNLESHLKKASGFERTLFTSGGDYLKEIKIGEASFLGKEVLPLLTMEELESLEVHVRSLFSRLVPAYPVTKQMLSLVAINESRRDYHHERGRRKAAR